MSVGLRLGIWWKSVLRERGRHISGSFNEDGSKYRRLTEFGDAAEFPKFKQVLFEAFFAFLY